MIIFRIPGKRGRVIIPHNIRLRMDLDPNDVLSFTEAPKQHSMIVWQEKLRGT